MSCIQGRLPESGCTKRRAGFPWLDLPDPHCMTKMKVKINFDSCDFWAISKYYILTPLNRIHGTCLCGGLSLAVDIDESMFGKFTS